MNTETTIFMIINFIGGAIIAGVMAFVYNMAMFWRYPIQVPIFKQRSGDSIIIGYDTAGVFRKKEGGVIIRCRKTKTEFTIENPSYHYAGSATGRGIMSGLMVRSTIGLVEMLIEGEKLYKPCKFHIKDGVIIIEPTSRNCIEDKVHNDRFTFMYNDVKKNEGLKKALGIAFIIFIVLVVGIVLATKGQDIWNYIKGAMG